MDTVNDMDKDKAKVEELNIDLSRFRSDSFKGESKPQRWLIHKRLPQGNVVAIASEGGAGKTELSLELFVAINDTHLLPWETGGKPWTHGGPWVMGGLVAKRRLPCLFLAGEDGFDNIDRRLLSIRKTQGAIASDQGYIIPASEVKGGLMLFGYSWPGSPIAPTPAFEWLDNTLEAMRAQSGELGILVLDTWSVLCSPTELDNADATAVVQHLMRLATKHDICVLILHHYKKPSGYGASKPDANRVRGASAIVNSCRLVYGLERLSDADSKIALEAAGADKGCAVRLEVLKSNIEVNRSPITLAWPEGESMIDVSSQLMGESPKEALVNVIRQCNAKDVTITKSGKGNGLFVSKTNNWPKCLHIARNKLESLANTVIEEAMVKVGEKGALIACDEVTG